MKLQVSLEVDPGVFDEQELRKAGATVIQHHHMGWLSLWVEADRLKDLSGLAGVDSYAPVLACEGQLQALETQPEWTELASGECGGLLRGRLEAGRWQGRVCFLRQTIEVLAKCFVRSHRTDAQDIVVAARGPGGDRVVCRHSDGLRDRSQAGMHDWTPGEVHGCAMWVGHLAPGSYIVRGGIDGSVRVGARLTPFQYEAEVRRDGPAAVRPAAARA